MKRTRLPVIVIAGEINDESFGEFSKELAEYEKSGCKKVMLEITSEGGSATAALAYYDKIKSSTMEIHGVVYGLAASAASLIFIACNKRYMSRNSWFMVHEDSLSDIDGKKVHEIEKEALHARRMEDQWCDLFYASTGTPVSTWKELNKNETYMTAEECLKLGFIDGVLE